MQTVVRRYLTSHAYNEATAATITTDILDSYFAEFATLHAKSGNR